ncbi:LAQU0S03e03202g1_1 [Lachancea quebecensis]|uniref:LAQU0S03e03202g1_1 n=1 Tax=Lachancea quebecensis TaxID=1654605 RepID=A0A0P1KNR0_9SACH|nr:LAQU0S03e03202g1_1 [Lachancea quebecensis]
MSNRKNTAASLLLRQYRELTDAKKAIPSFHIELDDDSNIFLWNIGVMVLNEDSIYHGGYFKAQMRFPEDFPFSPPTFRFTPAIYHPNVYRDGRLCISILHTSGDPTSEEPDSETWSPVQTVESVLISIVSLLEDPNISSPANVDAAVDYRKNIEQYKQRVQLEVERSKQDIPEGFVMPTSRTAYVAQRQAEPEETRDLGDNFWYDSDDEDEADIYGYDHNDEQQENNIEFDDDSENENDDDDDVSVDNDSVMDRKQPNKAEDESDDLEDGEMKLEK